MSAVLTLHHVKLLQRDRDLAACIASLHSLFLFCALARGICISVYLQHRCLLGPRYQWHINKQEEYCCCCTVCVCTPLLVRT